MPKPSCATHIPHSIRAYRKRCGLSQQELASMAGITGATLSRFERYQRLPDPKTLFACEVAFGVPLQQFAKRLYREVEAETRTRAAKIRERVAKANGKPSRLLELKLKTLERISESAKAHADAIVS